MKKHLCYLGLCLFPASLLAQQSNNNDADSMEVGELESVIIRSIRASKATPFTATNISKEEIQQNNNGQDMTYLLQQETSVVVSSDAGTGIGYTNLSIRGTDNTRINFTMNGIPVNNSESQGTFLVNIPDMASSTQSIQIQRGVGSSTNGGGAFGGNLSVNNMVNEEKAGARINAGIGSFNTQKLTLQAYTGRMKNDWAFDVRLSQIKSDGYIDRATSNLRALQFLSSWDINKRSRLTFNYMLGHEKTGQAWNGLSATELQADRTQNTLGLMPDGRFYDNQTDNYQQQFFQLFYDYKFSPFLKSQVALFLTKGAGYYEEYRIGDAYSDYGLNDFVTTKGDTFQQTDVVRQLWLDNNFYGGVYSLIYEKDKLALTFGGMVSQYDGLHYGDIKWASQGIPVDYRWYDLDAYKTEVNNFLKAVYQLSGKWSIYGDLQYRFVNFRMNGFRKNPILKPEASYNFINPKVGTQYIVKNEGSRFEKIYLSYAKASKEPNRNDFEANTVEIPKHEQMHDFELGYTATGKKYSWSANLYYMLYKDQLVLNGKINDVGAYTRVNVDNSYRAGVELAGNYEFHPVFSINANATFSQNKIKAFNEYIDNWDTWEQELVQHNNTDIAFSPNVVAALNLVFSPLRTANINPKHKDLQIVLQNKYVGRQYLDNTSTLARSLDAYNVSNLRINYSLPLKHYTVNAGLTVNNILGSEYITNGYTYAYSEAGALNQMNFYFPQAKTFFLFNLGITF